MLEISKTNATFLDWCDLDSDKFISVQEGLKVLSAEETLRADKFHFEIHKNRYIRGRAYLRLLLSELINEAPDAILIAQGKNNKPYLIDHSIHFNMSRSQGYATYAFNRDNPVGIDLEYIKPESDFQDVSEIVFSKTERQQLADKSKTESKKSFYHFWTAKEAYLKLIGTGLSIEPIKVSLHCESNKPMSCSLSGYPDAKLEFINLPVDKLVCCLSTYFSF